MESYGPVASEAHEHVSGPSKKLIIVTGVVASIVLAFVGGMWWFLSREAPATDTFPLVENGEQVWYALTNTAIAPASVPEGYLAVPTDLLQEGEFSARYAENGAVVALSPAGLVTFDPRDGKRRTLIERSGLDSASSAIAADASAAVLVNVEANALDVFLLDRTRPTVLTYAGSIPLTGYIYAVGFARTDLLVLETSASSFALYSVSGTGVMPIGSVTLAGTVSLLSVPVAHAWTYGSPLTSAGAVTTSSKRCTGSWVASLGSVSGSGNSPSTATIIWNDMSDAPSGLPANYSNPGSYCIQAALSITSGGGLLRSNDSSFLALLAPIAHAAPGDTWTVDFSIYNGTGITTASNTYTLTYTSSPTATLTLSPSSVDQGSSSALSWSSNVGSCTGTNFSTGGASSGTVSVSPSTTTTYTVTCSTATASATLTVLERPNLSASTPTPTSGNEGDVVTLRTTVSNSGVGAGAAGVVSFQRATSAAGANAYTVKTGSMPAIAAGTSAEVTATYGFTAPGTFYMRACADSSDVNDESNESDNCSAWQQVTVADVVDPEDEPLTVDLTASPTSVSSGGTVTLSWSTTGLPEECIGTNFETEGEISGSVEVTPSTNTTYSVTCSDATGQTAGPGTWQYRETDMTDLQCPWTDHNRPYSGMPSCDLYDPSGTSCDLGSDWRCKTNEGPGGLCVITTYVYACEGTGTTVTEDVSDSVTVTVALNECTDGVDNDHDGTTDASDLGCTGGTDTDETGDTVSCTLSSNPSPLTGNVSTTFTWTSNGTSCTGSGFSTNGAANGTSGAVVIVPGDTYQVQCTAPGAVACTKQLSASAPTAEISVNPSRVSVGGTTAVTWSTSQCTNVSVTRNAASFSTEASGTDVSAANITSQTIFTVDCDNGAATDTAIVNVVPRFDEF